MFTLLVIHKQAYFSLLLGKIQETVPGFCDESLKEGSPGLNEIIEQFSQLKDAIQYTN